MNINRAAAVSNEHEIEMENNHPVATTTKGKSSR
jgi:hypothetical protein